LKALELGVDEEKFLKQLEEKKEEEQLTSFLPYKAFSVVV